MKHQVITGPRSCLKRSTTWKDKFFFWEIKIEFASLKRENIVPKNSLQEIKVWAIEILLYKALLIYTDNTYCFMQCLKLYICIIIIENLQHYFNNETHPYLCGCIFFIHILGIHGFGMRLTWIAPITMHTNPRSR